MDSLLRLRRGLAERAEPEVASCPQLDSMIVPLRSLGQQSMSRSTGDAVPESEAVNPARRGPGLRHRAETGVRGHRVPARTAR
jgi:hypothetical protein